MELFRIVLRMLDPAKEFCVFAQDKDSSEGGGILFTCPYDHMSAKRFNSVTLHRDKTVVIAL